MSEHVCVCVGQPAAAAAAADWQQLMGEPRANKKQEEVEEAEVNLLHWRVQQRAMHTNIFFSSSFRFPH